MSATDHQDCTEQGARDGLSRRVWMGAAAGVALLGGVAAWYQRNAVPAPAKDPAVEALWAMQWPTPSGDTLNMTDFRGRNVLVNFWATWCPPCVAELPMLDAFQQQHASTGWQVLGLAVDQRDAVDRFLQRQPVQFPVALLGGQGLGLSKSLGNLAGGLPFTLVLSRDGSVTQRKIGELSQQDLDAWAGKASA